MDDRTYNKFVPQNFRLKRKLSIETLLEKFKPRALENYEFEYRTTNVNNSTFRHFWRIKALLFVSKSPRFNELTLRMESCLIIP